jgi:hypothetical protein
MHTPARPPPHKAVILVATRVARACIAANEIDASFIVV